MHDSQSVSARVLTRLFEVAGDPDDDPAELDDDPGDPVDESGDPGDESDIGRAPVHDSRSERVRWMRASPES